jgi:hypothetical protein
MPFQKQVNMYQAPAVAGDFATQNPRSALVAPEDGFVAGSAGVTVGLFAWVQSNGTVLNNGAGKPDGFIHREMNALITTYLGESGNVIQGGFPVTIMKTGDYYVTANGSSAVRGEKAYAKLQDGSVRFETTTSAPVSASFTAAQSGTTLTVTAVASGSISVGDLVTQATGSAAYVSAQLTGTPGSTGTYTLSVSQTVTSGSATSTSYIETDYVCSRAAGAGELAVMSL